MIPEAVRKDLFFGSEPATGGAFLFLRRCSGLSGIAVPGGVQIHFGRGLPQRWQIRRSAGERHWFHEVSGGGVADQRYAGRMAIRTMAPIPVTRRGVDPGVAEEHLNDPRVGTVFEQVSGEVCLRVWHVTRFEREQPFRGPGHSTFAFGSLRRIDRLRL